MGLYETSNFNELLTTDLTLTIGLETLSLIGQVYVEVFLTVFLETLFERIFLLCLIQFLDQTP